jgi:F0F1-type ATP synthase membrane subunit b/b'
MEDMSIPISLVDKMRELGESIPDKGLIEYNVVSGAINWANKFVLDKTGYSLEEIKKLTIFDIVPKQFHEKIKDSLSVISGSREPGSSIWPGKTTSGQVSWWYLLQAKTQHPLRWSQCEYVQTTEPSGTAFVFMSIQMDITNKYGAIDQKVAELDRWTRDQINELSRKYRSLEEFIKDEIRPALNGAKEAADSAKESKKALDELKEDFKKQINSINDKAAEHTGEILKLISTDVVHSKRITAFEQHVKMTTDLAIKSITMQADKAGKGLSKKVTIPVSVTAAVVTIAQYLIQNWPF